MRNRMGRALARCAGRNNRPEGRWGLWRSSQRWGAPLLRAAPARGMRGEAARDVAALATTVQRIGSLLAAQPEIQEIDLNPVTVYDAGEGVLALDALIVTNAPNGRNTS